MEAALLEPEDARSIFGCHIAVCVDGWGRLLHGSSPTVRGILIRNGGDVMRDNSLRGLRLSRGLVIFAEKQPRDNETFFYILRSRSRPVKAILILCKD